MMPLRRPQPEEVTKEPGYSQRSASDEQEEDGNDP
jgi:hypothetical protein